MTKAERIDEIKKLLTNMGKNTPTKWRVERQCDGAYAHIIGSGASIPLMTHYNQSVADMAENRRREAVAKFIAATREVIPMLLENLTTVRQDLLTQIARAERYKTTAIRLAIMLKALTTPEQWQTMVDEFDCPAIMETDQSQ